MMVYGVIVLNLIVEWKIVMIKRKERLIQTLVKEVLDMIPGKTEYGYYRCDICYSTNYRHVGRNPGMNGITHAKDCAWKIAGKLKKIFDREGKEKL